MIHRKKISALLILSSVLSIGCFSENNQQNELPFESISGEIFVRMFPGFERDDLQEIVDDFEVSINRTLGNGYVINVPEGFEPLWITQFSSVPIISDADYNRYGYEFSITVNDSTPYAENNELFVTVNYSGCDGGHAFSLERPGEFSNNMLIWLFKSTPDEECEMAISEDLTFTIPRFIQLSARVIIEDPFGNQALLWPEPEEPSGN